MSLIRQKLCESHRDLNSVSFDYFFKLLMTYNFSKISGFVTIFYNIGKEMTKLFL